MKSLFNRSKKGMDGNMASYFQIFLGIVIVAFVFFILSDALKDTQDVNSTGYNATSNLETGMLNATEQAPQAGKLIGIGLILGVIGLAVFGARRYGLF